MQTRVQYARILMYTILILTSLSVLAVPGGSRGPEIHPQAEQPGDENRTQRTRTVTVTEWSTTTQWSTTSKLDSTTITRWNATTQWNITTQWSSSGVSPVILWILPVGQPIADIVTALLLGLVVLVFLLTGSALVLRSRSSKSSQEADSQRRLVRELQNELSLFPPERASSASYALKLLLELGVLQPKDYMEKKMIAERLERKMSAKQLLDEGLISKEQYDAVVRGEGSQDRD